MIGHPLGETKAAQAMRPNEELFRLAFEGAPVGMVIGAGDRVITKVNRAMCKMIGYEEHELLGRRVTDFIHPGDRERFAPVTGRLFAGQTIGFTNQKRYLRKDGETFWARTTAKAFHGPDAKVVFALGIVQDVTAEKLAQDALQREHARSGTCSGPATTSGNCCPTIFTTV